MICPKPLQPGAKVALVAPASPAAPDAVRKAEALVKELGLEPVLYPSCDPQNRHGYLAAEDARRAEDLHRAFADPRIQGVWCLRGGYGAHRILPLLDPEVFRANPKWFGGYSDITAVHIFFNQVCGFQTYHCPMPATEPDPNAYTRFWLERALFGGLSGPLSNPPDQPWEVMAPGSARGILCGGNLTLLAASLGTPWEIDTRGKILFLEDIGEKPYRIDAMVTQLRNAGKFRQCAAVLLGAWTNCQDEKDGLGLEEIFSELILPAGKPVIRDLACGHCAATMSLALGRECIIEAGTITLAGEG